MVIRVMAFFYHNSVGGGGIMDGSLSQHSFSYMSMTI